MLELFYKGLGIGFLLALPIGPTMILCIRYTIAFGVFMGVVAGSGAALADAVYGIIASCGMVWMSDFFKQNEFYLHSIGSLMLCYLGIKTLCNRVSLSQENVPVSRPKVITLFLTTLTLTGTSPLTFIGASGFCAAFGIGEPIGNFYILLFLG